MDAYMTRYTVGDGLISKVVLEPNLTAEELVVGKRVRPVGLYVYLQIGKDVFLNLDDARAQCERDRTKKIASLKKQIAKLEKMVF